MKKYLKEYRVIAEFDEEDQPTEGNFVYCYNGYVAISNYDRGNFRIDIVGTGRYLKILKKLQERNIKIKRNDRLDGEGVIICNKAHVVFEICEAKKQRKHPVGVKDIKNNLPYYNRRKDRLSRGGV